jgi:hypothetical protein
MLTAIRTWLRSVLHPRRHYREMISPDAYSLSPSQCAERDHEEAEAKAHTRERLKRITERYEQTRRQAPGGFR